MCVSRLANYSQTRGVFGRCANEFLFCRNQNTEHQMSKSKCSCSKFDVNLRHENWGLFSSFLLHVEVVLNVEWTHGMRDVGSISIVIHFLWFHSFFESIRTPWIQANEKYSSYYCTQLLGVSTHSSNGLGYSPPVGRKNSFCYLLQLNWTACAVHDAALAAGWSPAPSDRYTIDGRWPLCSHLTIASRFMDINRCSKQTIYELRFQFHAS